MKIVKFYHLKAKKVLYIGNIGDTRAVISNDV